MKKKIFLIVYFVGKGAGILNIQAETSDGALCSLPLEIYDCVWYDKATSSSHNDEYGNQWTGNEATLTRNSDYSTLTGGNTGNKYHVWNFRSYNFSIIEFDLKKIGGATNNICLQLRNTNYNVLRQVALSTWNNTSLDTWYHFKFDFENRLIYLNNSSVTMNDIAPTKLMFCVSSETSELQFKNFKVY